MIGYVSQQEDDLSKDEATFGSKKTALAGKDLTSV